MPTSNPRRLELLIGKLPRPKNIAYRRVHSFSDDDLTYEKIEFVSEGEPIRAYIVRPKHKPTHRLPVVYCHHQHDHQYSLGKREVIGRGGDSRQAYAYVLAKKGYLTFAPDAKCFEERMIPGLKEEKGEVYEFARLLCQGKSLQWRLLAELWCCKTLWTENLAAHNTGNKCAPSFEEHVVFWRPPPHRSSVRKTAALLPQTLYHSPCAQVAS
jgi:hypothetical protein